MLLVFLKLQHFEVLPISHKENEKRRTLIPSDICRLRHPDVIYIEKGYGDVLGYTDEDYLKLGIKTGYIQDISIIYNISFAM